MTRARPLLLIAALLLAATSPLGAQAQRLSDTGAADDVGSRMRRADAAYAAGDRERAEREYAAILAADSTQSHAAFRLAQLLERRDRATAIALYRRYVALEPRDAWGHIALANALGANGDMTAALAQYDEAGRLAPNERDVRVGRARLLARTGRTDDAITEYEAVVARTPGDAEAWRDLASLRRRAGRYGEAITALERVRALDGESAREADRDIGRLRALSRATVEPLIGGSIDSDGLMTLRAGASLTSALLGRARLTASGLVDRASDDIAARGTQDLMLGLQYRPLAQLRLELAGGVSRADRTPIDTGVTAGPGPGRPLTRASTYESFPVGRARLVWRKPGDGLAVDARAGRQLLDASSFLVAQGVLRDEASLALDMRLSGPVRVRGFGRIGSVHNARESNDRRVVGGALVYAPGPWEVSVRGQELSYGRPTTLAYFAPRFVRTAELTTYLERETASGTTFSLDLGGGAQQVAEWTSTAGTWSPSLRVWTQIVKPLDASLSIGTEIEAYDSRASGDAPVRNVTTTSKWVYGAASVFLRKAF